MHFSLWQKSKACRPVAICPWEDPNSELLAVGVRNMPQNFSTRGTSGCTDGLMLDSLLSHSEPHFPQRFYIWHSPANRAWQIIKLQVPRKKGKESAIPHSKTCHLQWKTLILAICEREEGTIQNKLNASLLLSCIPPSLLPLQLLCDLGKIS